MHGTPLYALAYVPATLETYQSGQKVTEESLCRVGSAVLMVGLSGVYAQCDCSCTSLLRLQAEALWMADGIIAGRSVYEPRGDACVCSMNRHENSNNLRYKEAYAE